MGPINDAISHYQQIIGAYDKQLWERSVELAVLKGLKNVTSRKTAKVNPDLIDVDLVRGSTFSKPKPEHGWLGVSWRAVPRVLFLPLYYKWWKKSTGVRVYCLLTFLYIMQVVTFSLYVLDNGLQLDSESLSLAHMLTPCIMMFVLALIHTQIMATYVSLKKSRSTRDAVDCCKPAMDGVQQSGSEQDSVGSRDTGIDLNPDPDVSDAAAARHQRATPGVKPSSMSSSHRRRSRSLVPCLPTTTTIATANDPDARIDADDEEDDPSCAGKNPMSLAATRRQNARSASIDKTVEWLMTQTDSSSNNNNSMLTEHNSMLTEHNSMLTEQHLKDRSVVLIDPKTAGADATSRQHAVQTNHSSPDLFQLDTRGVELTEVIGLRRRLLGSGRQAATDDIVAQDSAEVLGTAAGEDAVSEISSGQQHAHHQLQQQQQQQQQPLSGRCLVAQDSRQTLLSVTGVSSCDSEAGAAVNKRRTKTKVATSEWEYNMNTDMTSTPSASATELSDNEQEDNVNTADLPRHAPQNVSCAVKESSLPSDRVSCMIWENGEAHKVELTVLDIGWKIIERVDKLMSEESCSYFVIGLCLSLCLVILPVAYRLYHTKDQLDALNFQTGCDNFSVLAQLAFGQNWRQCVVIVNGLIERFCLSIMLFFLLTVAERTFQQRLLYAKNFSYLTSSRRAKKYNLPHFRLNKVRAIRSWLSLRSFLKRRGPQRSVENIVSAAFLVTIVLISILCIELLQDSGSFLDHLGNWELVMWCLSLGVFLMRFITLGTNINKKYRNFSVLITEQINLYLHMEQKPHKKEELLIANSVLKLAENLLKELESPFRVSGLSANPLLYNITKVVVLSAFSAVLTELLGFKLKLYKIKIRA